MSFLIQVLILFESIRLISDAIIVSNYESMVENLEKEIESQRIKRSAPYDIKIGRNLAGFWGFPDNSNKNTNKIVFSDKFYENYLQFNLPAKVQNLRNTQITSNISPPKEKAEEILLEINENNPIDKISFKKGNN